MGCKHYSLLSYVVPLTYIPSPLQCVQLESNMVIAHYDVRSPSQPIYKSSGNVLTVYESYVHISIGMRNMLFALVPTSLTCQNPLSRTSCITSHYATYSSPFEAIINPRVPVHFAYFYFCVNTNTPQSVRNSHTCTSLTIHYIIHSTHPPRRHHQPLFLQFNNLVIFAILYRHSIAVH